MKFQQTAKKDFLFSEIDFSERYAYMINADDTKQGSTDK